MTTLAEVFAREDDPPTLAAQLRAARAAAHLTQRALATRAALRQATVATIEGGANTDAATLAKLADALGVALVVHPGAAPPDGEAPSAITDGSSVMAEESTWAGAMFASGARRY